MWRRKRKGSSHWDACYQKPENNNNETRQTEKSGFQSQIIIWFQLTVFFMILWYKYSLLQENALRTEDYILILCVHSSSQMIVWICSHMTFHMQDLASAKHPEFHAFYWLHWKKNIALYGNKINVVYIFFILSKILAYQYLIF